MGECLKVERILARLGVGHDSGRTEAYDLLTTAFLGCKTGDLSGIGLEEEIADALKLLSAPDAQNIGHEWPGCGVVGSLAFALNGGCGPSQNVEPLTSHHRSQVGVVALLHFRVPNEGRRP